MSRRVRRRELLRSTASAASVATVGCLGLGPSPEERLESYDDELLALGDLESALDAGYETAGRYVRTDEGALGEPFYNRDVTDLSPTQPHAVVFDLTDDGGYEPLGLKWFAPADDRDEPPSLFGREFDGPIQTGIAGVPEHYALHAWLFRDNPEGTFALYNPAVEPAPLVDAISPVRASLEPYHSSVDAEADGFENTEKCIAVDDAGYGVPFERRDAVSEGSTDPESPPILLYRVTPSWSYRLLGAEWYVPADDANATPSLFGRTFHEPAAGHSPEGEQPRHYGLHAWLFAANPNGMFARRNPRIPC